MMKRKLLLLSGLLALLLTLSLAAPVSADTNRYVDPAGTCATFSPCYTTISAAVAASGPGDIIYVFPGTYAESVDLSNMATPGDITLITVDASGTPGAGTATVSPSTGAAIFNSVWPFPGNVTIKGFNVTSPDDDGINLRVNSDVLISRVLSENSDDTGVVVFSDTGNVTVTNSCAQYNGGRGFSIVADGDVTITRRSCAQVNASMGFEILAGGDVTISDLSWTLLNGSHGFYIDADGNVSISDCGATSNLGDGYHVDAGGNVTVNPSGADGNRSDGFWISAGGDVSISGSSADGNVDPFDGDGFQIAAGGKVTITGSSADGNNEEGIDVESAGGNVTLSDCSATGNGGEGIDADDIGGNVSIDGCSSTNNTGSGYEIGYTGVGGNVTINPSSAEGNGLHGFYVNKVAGNVTISGSSANENGDGGFHTTYTHGNVTISTSSADGNIQDGFHICDVDGDVSISGCSTDGNGDTGFAIYARGNVSINPSSAEGNSGGGFFISTFGDVTISNSSANGNIIDGFRIGVDGDVSISGSSANGNSRYGVALYSHGATGGVVDNVTIQDCHIRGNGEDGIEFRDLLAGGTHLVNGSIICDNVASGLRLLSEVVLNAEGNWWGDASGPTHPTNPGGTGDAIIDGASDASGVVHFDPWIDTITHSATVDPVKVGQLTTVSFQFSGGGGAVFLGLGPGDPNGIPPFTLSTDNGILMGSGEMGTTVHEFIDKPNGVLSVILIPDTGGTAVVSLDGPCKLDDSITITAEKEARVAVGGEARPVNKLAVLAPWIGLGILLALAIGGIFGLRRLRTHQAL